ncbi:DKNYY domain-containing protein [Spirosoma litoris]
MNSLLKKIFGTFGSLAITLIGLLVLACGPSSRRGYRIEKGEVVMYRGFPANRSVIPEADTDSFTIINDDYGKDKTHVFYIGQIIQNADPATFEYLSGAYSRDKTNGYSRHELISTDGPHFRVIPNSNDTPTNVTAEGAPYVCDSHRVYKDMFIIEGADPASFVFVPMFNGYYLARDKRRVYFQEKPIEGVDGATFRKVSDFNFCDKHRAWGLVLGQYTHWAPLENVDLANFSSAGQYYAKDKNSKGSGVR